MGTILVVFGVITWAITRHVQGLFEENQLSIVSDYGMRLRSTVENWRSTRTLVVSSLAKTAEFFISEDSDRQEVAAYLRGLRAVNPSFADFLIIDAEGRIVHDTTGRAVSANLSDRDYVRASLNGESYCTGFFRSRNSGSATMTISVPVYIDGKVAYVAAGYITLEKFIDVFSRSNLGGLGQLYFVNSSGQMISDRAYIDAFKMEPNIESDPSFMLKGVAVEALKEKRDGIGVYLSSSGNKVFGAYQWVEGLQIGLVVEYDFAKVMMPIDRLVLFVSIISIASFVAVLIMTLISFYLFFKPVDALIKAAEDIIAKNYDEPITIRTGTKFDNLIDRFNAMAEAVSAREAGLEDQAARDSLTGLYNHGALEDFIDREIARRKRTQEGACFVMIDIDHFKLVNDTYGHQAGDQILKEISRILVSCVRAGDIVGRYGGEEFAIFIDLYDPDSISAFCERIRSAIENHTFKTTSGDVRVTVSLGFCCQRVNEETKPFDIIKRADGALYRAKSDGRNCVRSA